MEEKFQRLQSSPQLQLSREEQSDYLTDLIYQHCCNTYRLYFVSEGSAGSFNIENKESVLPASSALQMVDKPDYYMCHTTGTGEVNEAKFSKDCTFHLVHPDLDNNHDQATCKDYCRKVRSIDQLYEHSKSQDIGAYRARPQLIICFASSPYSKNMGDPFKADRDPVLKDLYEGRSKVQYF